MYQDCANDNHQRASLWKPVPSTTLQSIPIEFEGGITPKSCLKYLEASELLLHVDVTSALARLAFEKRSEVASPKEGVHCVLEEFLETTSLWMAFGAIHIKYGDGLRLFTIGETLELLMLTVGQSIGAEKATFILWSSAVDVGGIPPRFFGIEKSKKGLAIKLYNSLQQLEGPFHIIFSTKSSLRILLSGSRSRVAR